MKVLLFGSSGMLGKALDIEGKRRGLYVVGADKVDSPIITDVTDDQALVEMIDREKPDVIINTVAITGLEACENNPGMAYTVNSRPVAIMTQACKEHGIYLVQISTDQYYSGDIRLKHNENHNVELLNEYARTKYIAERFALTYQDSLIIRTNIVGFKRQNDSQAFADWVFQSLEADSPMVLFNDYFCSSITVSQLSRYLFDVLPKRPGGVLNIGSREVFSKRELIETIAQKAGYHLTIARTGSVLGLWPRRAESAGLDVAKIEELLGVEMPSLDEVVRKLIYEYKEV